jgi:aryl-alcohol dehydrogenase-like predicted oxidoreductase
MSDAVRVQLGHSPVQISRVVLGCMFSSRLNQPEVERIVHAAYDAGITSFDTAPLYDFHRGEEQLGRALRDRRQHVQILTKAGLRWDGTHGRELFSFMDARGQRRVVRRDSRPDSLRVEVEQSLLRLGCDALDLVQLHQPDEDTPIAQSIEALAALVRAGSIRGYGVSNFSAPQLEAACAAGQVASVQSEYNLLQRWPERELLPLCVRRGVGLLAYSPLAKGVLAGRSRLRSAAERRSSRGSHYDDAVARVALRPALSGALDALARASGLSQAQLALAWLLAQPGVSGVVVGASSVAQVEELARAAQLKLPQRDLDELAAGFARAGLWMKVAERVRGSAVGRLVQRISRVS